jgi:uncharacterized glyoxalase superfamily protein PhnB
MAKDASKQKLPDVAGLDHIYIPTRDFEKAWAFWGEASGGEVKARWGESDHQAGLVSIGGADFVVAQENETLEDPELGYRVQYGRPILHFATPNVDKLYRDLANRGVSILRGPLTTHWGKRVLTIRAGEIVIAFVEVKGAGKKTKGKKR